MRLVAILLPLSCLFTTFQAISAHPISSPELQIFPVSSNGDTYLQSISRPLSPTEIDQLGFNSINGGGCISPDADPRLIRNGVYIANAEGETKSEDMLCKKGFIGLAFKGAKMVVKSGATDAAIKGIGQVAKALGKRDVDENRREGQLVFLRRSSQQQNPFERRGFAAFKSLKSFKSFGKIFKGFGGKANGALGAAGNVAMVASVASPLLASAPKAAVAAESAAVAKTAAPKAAAAAPAPAPAPAAGTKPKPKTEPKKEEGTAAPKGDKEKTALPSSENRKRETVQDVEVLPQRRGTVSTTAGQVVTGLMVLGLGKQLYNAVGPKLQSHQAPSQPPPQMYQQAYPPPQMYSPPTYANGPSSYYSSSGFSSRSLATPKEEGGVDDDVLLGKRSVMDAASHFVTVGFAVQAIQDNFKPIVREMGRLEHKGLHEARKYMGGGKQVQQGGPPPPSVPPGPGPRGYYQRRGLQESEAEKAEGETEQNLLTRRGTFGNAMNHPAMHKMMNGANYLVTLSMLTGLAGQYVDSGIAKAKEKTRPQQQPQLQPGRMRRSLYTVEEISNPLVKRIGEQQASDAAVRPNIREEEKDGDMSLEKRVDLAGVGKFVSQAANSKMGKTAIKMAGFLI